MPDPAPPNPPEQPEQPPRTRSGEVLRESRRFGQWIVSLRPDQLQSFALVGVTVFLIALAGWVVYRADMARERDKDRDVAAKEATVRECNTQGELIRQANSTELEKSRAGTKDLLAMVLAHQSQEREKDRQHILDRDREHVRTVKEIRDAWAAFAIRIGDLERYLRSKQPEEDGIRIWGAFLPRLRFNVP